MMETEDQAQIMNNLIRTSTYRALYNVLGLNDTHTLSKIFQSTETEELVLLLSECYEEVLLKNIPLTPQTKVIVETKLIDLQFISENKNHKKDEFKNYTSVKDQLHFTCELIHSFLQKYLDKEFEINMEFIFYIRYIAQQISVLKRRMDYTYEILPWEEMQFCLVIYLKILLNAEKTDFNYKLIVNRTRLLKYLFYFHSKLEEIRLQFKEDDLKRKKGSRRNMLKHLILKRYPVFKDLYEDFSLLRNIYSMEKINFYVNKALAVNLEENTITGKLIIERTLQVMGEYLKNTPESPNLSDNLYKRLLKSAPRNLKNILIGVRNMLSHAYSLNRKLELESSKDPELFKKIQTDLQKIQIDIVYIIYKQKIDIFKVFLNRLLVVEDMKEITCIFKQTDIKNIQSIEENSINLEEFLKVKELVLSFCNQVLEESNEDSEIIDNVLDLIAAYEFKIKNVSLTYVDAINKIFHLVDAVKNTNVLKNSIRTYLTLLATSEPQSWYNDVFLKLRQISDNFKARRNYNPNNFLNPDEKCLKLQNILIEISNYLKWRLRKIKWIEEIEDKLTLKEDNSENENRAKEVFQMVQIKLESGQDNLMVGNAIKKTIQSHETKYELMNMLKENLDIFQNKVKFLDLSSKRQKEILYNHENKNYDRLLLMIKEIDDNYGTFLKKIGDIFPLPQYINTVKTFFKNLKLKKSVQKKVDKAVEDAINDEVKQCYSQRLHTLRQCLSHIKDISIEDIDDKNLSVSLEMVVLDLMEFLEKVGILSDNKMLILENSPVLIGKQLRNYLAHGNILTDLLPYNPIIALIFHADTLVNIGDKILTQKNAILGYKAVNPSFTFKNYFEKSLKLINKQMMLFDCAKNGDIKETQELIDSGANIFGINYNSWTVLNFAICGANIVLFKHLIKSIDNINDVEAYKLLKFAASLSNIEAIEYLIKQRKLDLNYKFENDTTLLNIALEHDQKAVWEFLIKTGADLSNKGSADKTTLHLASQKGCLKIVQTIVDTHSEMINLVTNDNYTALHLAAQNGHIDVVDVLLSNNANISAKNCYDLTPFEVAAQYGQIKILEYFLECPQYDLQKENLTSAFQLATGNGHWNVLEILLQKSNDLDSKREFILHLSSLYGHLNIIKELFHKQININCTDSTGKTALHLASQCGHLEVVKILLDSKIDRHILDNDSWTALHWACYNKHINVAELLLCNKTSVVITDKQGKSAFHLAVENGNLDILKMLFAYEADCNATTVTGQTALHLAAYHGHCNVIELLINICKIDIDIKDNNEETPLIVAAENGHSDVVELLLKYKANINLRTRKEGFSAITRAAAQGHLDVLLNLLKFNADIEIQETSGWRPIHWAVQNGYIDILKVLLKHNVDVNARYEHGGTALLTSIRNGHIDVVKKLLKHGAHINAMLINILPLRVAAHIGHKEIAMILLARGAEVDAAGIDKITPLHAASWNGHLELVKLLLESGSNVFAKTEEEWTALHFAAKFGYYDIIKVLLDYCADIYVENDISANAFHTACEAGHNNIVEMLLNLYGVDANVGSSKGITGLHWASANERVEVVNTLINNKADVNIRAHDESTPLHWAIGHLGSAIIVKILIKNKANLNVKDNNGATPLHLASINGNEKVVEELLENNADINAENQNIVPLHLAVASGHSNIVKMLLEKGAMMNRVSLHQKTSLHIASEKGFKDIVQMLLENGVEVNGKDENGMTALHLAVQHGHADITIWLLACECDINVLDNRKRTPLYLAIVHKHEHIAKFLIDSDINDFSNFFKTTPLHESLFNSHLLENYANLNLATTTGWTALHAAAGTGLQTIVHLLIIKGANINAVTINNETPLFFASLQGHYEIVEELLENNCYVNIKTKPNELNALSVAAQEGHSKILWKLIQYKSDINSKNYQGLTPLHIAALYGHMACFKILLENGANLNAVTTSGWSALHIAATEGFIDIVDVILKKDIKTLNTTNDEGNTPMDLAQKQGHAEVVAKLSEYNKT